MGKNQNYWGDGGQILGGCIPPGFAALVVLGSAFLQPKHYQFTFHSLVTVGIKPGLVHHIVVENYSQNIRTLKVSQ